MRRWLGLLVVLGIVAVLARRRHTTPPNKSVLAVAILKEVADTSRRDMSWYVHGKASRAKLEQEERAELTGDASTAHVATDSWRLDLELSSVAVITCSISGGDVGDTPEYGFISFRPEHGDAWNELFSVGFPEPSIDVLQRICAKHGIPVTR